MMSIERLVLLLELLLLLPVIASSSVCCPLANRLPTAFCGGDPDIRCCPESGTWACHTGLGDYWCQGSYIQRSDMGIPCNDGDSESPDNMSSQGPTSGTCALSTTKPPPADNPCSGKDPKLANIECLEASVREQAGANVTMGYVGSFNTDVEPIVVPYYSAGLCPVNVHWHLGTEHLSVGEYDETGKGATDVQHRRQLAGKTRGGFQCKLFNGRDDRFSKPYDWKHCTDMEVGQTYEVHWPHSIAGACGTPNQYQTPFADGVFCVDGKITETQSQIGVQAQVFTVINDEAYYYPDLMRGMIVDGAMGVDVAKYTGSTTGTSRDNTICSQYAPITWQVDRKCHLISASTFDKMCADMKAQRDDMSEDLYPHGSRPLVADYLAANNFHHLRG